MDECKSPSSPRLIIIKAKDEHCISGSMQKADNSKPAESATNDSVFLDEEILSPGTNVRRRRLLSCHDELHPINSTPLLPGTRSRTTLVLSRGSTDSDSMDILDRHISKTIDTLGEDDCNYYRPVSQESYDDFDLPPPPRLADMRWCITTPNNNGKTEPMEGDSGYSASPSPDMESFLQLPTFSDSNISLTPQINPNSMQSESRANKTLLPNFSGMTAVPPSAVYNHSPLSMYSCDSGSVASYLPPVWAQLQNSRNELRRHLPAYGLRSFLPQDNLLEARSQLSRPALFGPYRSNSPNVLANNRHGEGSKTPKSVSPVSIPSSMEKVDSGWRRICRECPRRFNSVANLENHMDAAHRGIRPFKCTTCDKKFAQRATLRTHMRVHTGEKPYVCNTCNRRFADLSTCKKHQRVHDGQKPYECNICQKRFSQSGNMLRHRECHEKKGETIAMASSAGNIQ